MSHLFTTDALLSLLTLTLLEIVLGIDNIIFISILAGKLQRSQQKRARTLGLLGAMFSRIALLLSIAWLTRLRTDLFTLFGHGFSGRDLILLAGGLFLIAKSVSEIHGKLEGADESYDVTRKVRSLGMAIVQIMLIDLVFSFDSILTAVGLAQHVEIMIAAIVLSIGIMIGCAGAVSAFVDRHPTVKMLALSFLIMIGFLLTLEAFAVEVEKSYVYVAMAFALGVELLNMRLRKKSADHVALHETPHLPDSRHTFREEEVPLDR
ncbi:Membrane protein TerC, possibly involved in tellurium resistance [Catalinimonas alkaloidigena]|uniref:Membrane protein TerC, possibly involved in tellurium resistance n=1 Tax=Catalinimonas alkaloidigena TaxID=1075417 RepID=A0A1G8Y3C1_9BACT|nr:TerC family protein [Catalinimonas alkaloidigena]SDJ97338.1 Membrane protein TerC, possibly involved in tellurium resistance [Catalinimonas alkaloidigena]